VVQLRVLLVVLRRFHAPPENQIVGE
jgi:hypothetical protein